MSTVGIFVLLLVAFFVLHRWYIRPQDDGRPDPRAAGTAVPRENPGAPDREPDPHAQDPGDAAPGGSTAADGGGPGGGGSGGGSGGGGGGSGSGSGDGD